MIEVASSESTSQPITPQGMQLARRIMESRLQKLGASSPRVAIKDGNDLVVRFAGSHNPVRTASILDITGQLQLFDLEPSLAAPSVTRNQEPLPTASVYSLLEPLQKEASTRPPQAYYLVKTSASHQVVGGPAPSLHALFASFRSRRQPSGTQVLEVPAGREPVKCKGVENCPGASKSGASWYLFKLPPAMTGKDLVESGITSNTDPCAGRPIVTLEFTPSGSQAFRRITKAEYDRGRVNAGEAGKLGTTSRAVINRYAGHDAVVLDGVLEEAPYIDYTDASLSQGIFGNAQITEPSKAAAVRTALVLQSGSLPFALTPVARASCARQ